MNQKIQDLSKTIEGLTLLEVSDLVKTLEERLGVSAAMPVMAAAPMAESKAAAEEEKTEFDVTLVSGGAEKIKAIKELRTLTNLPLKEAKDAVDAGNFLIKSGVSKEEAEKMKKQLEDIGAIVKFS